VSKQGVDRKSHCILMTLLNDASTEQAKIGASNFICTTCIQRRGVLPFWDVAGCRNDVVTNRACTKCSLGNARSFKLSLFLFRRLCRQGHVYLRREDEDDDASASASATVFTKNPFP
jgi:hypothetical protein